MRVAVMSRLLLRHELYAGAFNPIHAETRGPWPPDADTGWDGTSGQLPRNGDQPVFRCQAVGASALVLAQSCPAVRPYSSASTSPGICSAPTGTMMDEPAKSSPTGSCLPPRHSARKASATARKESVFSGRLMPCPSSG